MANQSEILIFYDWTGLERTDDTNYDIVRQMVAELGETLDDFSQK
jgi:hypothetical protein